MSHSSLQLQIVTRIIESWPRRKLTSAEMDVRIIKNLFNPNHELCAMPEGWKADALKFSRDNLLVAFSHNPERRALVEQALVDEEARNKLVSLFPYVEHYDIIFGNIKFGVIGAALAKVHPNQLKACAVWYGKLAYAMSLLDDSSYSYLINTGHGPRYMDIQEHAKKKLTPDWYGITVREEAQKLFLSLFSHENSDVLTNVLEFQLDKDPEFTQGVDVKLDDITDKAPGLLAVNGVLLEIVSGEKRGKFIYEPKRAHRDARVKRRA